jgi:cytochrome c-type biogenesis protein
LLGRIPIAFAAGLVSFLAPCVLPLVPGYLSAVSAVDAGRLGERTTANVGALLRELGLVTRDELEAVELRLAQLEHRLRLLEGDLPER